MNISFVIPSYNSASMVPDAVRSIFDHNFSEGDEVIIINDASTDESVAVLEALTKEFYPHVTVITNVQNKGCPASRNVGITQAKNELIFNLDADNILAPYSIEKLKAALMKEQADIAAFGEYFYFKTTPRDITHKWVCKTGRFTLADFFSGIINQGPGGNFLYRKAFWEKIGGYWEYGKGLHEAWGFSLKMLINGAVFIVVPETYYFHRYSHQSLFVRESKKADEERMISKKFIEPALHLLTSESRDYINANPDWYSRLDSHPLYLADGSRGKNGKITWTSPFRTVIYKLRKIFS